MYDTIPYKLNASRPPVGLRRLASIMEASLPYGPLMSRDGKELVCKVGILQTSVNMPLLNQMLLL